MLKLGRRANIFLPLIGNRYNGQVRVSAGFKRYFRFTVLYLVSFRYANRFLRDLGLHVASRAKGQCACVGDQAVALVRWVHVGRCLAIYGESRVDQGVNEGISNLDFGGERYYRQASAFRFAFRTFKRVIRLANRFFLVGGLNYALRRAKIWVRGVTQVNFASQKTARGRERFAMECYLFQRVVVGGRYVSTNVAGVLASNDPHGQDGVLRYDQISDYDHRRGDVVRHAVLTWNICSEDCHKAFLSSDCVGTVCEVADFVVASLVSSHVGNCQYLAHLSIASCRLALSATSESRYVGDLRAHLRELVRQLAVSSPKDFALRQRFVGFASCRPFSIR